MARPKRITLTPTALDRNGVSAAQSPGANGDFTINGDLATAQSLDRNGIGASQTPTAGGTLTLDGAAGLWYPNGTPVTVYGGSDESGRTFTVKGTNKFGYVITEAITGPNNTTVSGSTLFYGIIEVRVDAATAGAVEIGIPGIATFATPQHITAYAGGDESGDTITIYGEDRRGVAITDTITGVNASTVASSENFSKVYKITTSGAVTSMEIGVDGTCDTPWVALNQYNNFAVGLGIEISSGGSLTYTVQHTFDDLFASGFVEGNATTFNHATLAAQTANADGNYSSPPIAARLSVTAHTSGSVQFNVVQLQ